MSNWVRQLKSELRGEFTKATPLMDEQRRIRELEKEVKHLKIEKDFLKKLQFSWRRMKWRFALTQRLQESYLANHLCQLFSVHRSSYRCLRGEVIGEMTSRFLLKEKVREGTKEYIFYDLTQNFILWENSFTGLSRTSS